MIMVDWPLEWIVRFMNSPSKSPAQGTTAGKSHKQFAEEVLRAEAQAILNTVALLDDQFDRAVETLVACEGNVIVSGMGKSGIIAQKLSATLASTGTPSHWLHPTEAMHGDLGRIRSNDALILISRSGGSDDILSLATLVRQDNVPVVAITAESSSHLARNSDLCLCIGDVEEACPLNLAPTTSTTATLAISDALALAISRRRQFTADDFHKRHPGGSLGRLMMGVLEAARFRVEENLTPVRDDLTLANALAEADRGGRRTGAVLFVDSSGVLSGIFTDADLRRLLITEGPDALQRNGSDVMTTHPKRLTDQSVVRDAVQMVRELRVDEIPIVNDAGHPVAMLDVQDLIALKVIQE
jgi:arabinose-5-phosphate isomerase